MHSTCIRTFRLHQWMRRYKSSARISCLSRNLSTFPWQSTTCLATCKKEESLRDQYAAVVCILVETVGHLNCARDESLITIETKIHRKSFTVANKSAKTTKVFHSETFALYVIYPHQMSQSKKLKFHLII